MSNFSLLRYRDDLANRTSLWPEYEIVRSMTGQIYSLSPNYDPKNVDKIIEHFVKEFRNSEHVTEAVCDLYLFDGSLNSLECEMREILFKSEDFLKLNEPNDHGDFIDLDAVLQNVWYDLNVHAVFDKLFESDILFELKEEN